MEKVRFYKKGVFDLPAVAGKEKKESLNQEMVEDAVPIPGEKAGRRKK